MELMANITGVVKSVFKLYERVWTAAAARLDPESISAAVQGAGAHRLCVAGHRAGCDRGGPADLLVKIAVEVGRRLYREAASRVDPNAVSALLQGVKQAYDVFMIFFPWVAPWIASLLRYIRQPAVLKYPRHVRERSYSAMAERAGERRRDRQVIRRLTSRTNHTNIKARLGSLVSVRMDIILGVQKGIGGQT